MARNEERDQDYDSSASAAKVAVSLISSARVILKLDTAYTEYSAQYLVDYACSKKEDEQGGMGSKLTVKDCFEFVFSKGIPKDEHWPHLGCVFKPPASYKPALVSMKGEVVEADKLKEAFKLLMQQPVGAKLHVFSPEIDLVGEGIYRGPSSDGSRYVGLRDVVMVAVEKEEGEVIATVRIDYKKKDMFIKVTSKKMLLGIPPIGDDSQVQEPTSLLVDFCIPRLSTN